MEAKGQSIKVSVNQGIKTTEQYFKEMNKIGRIGMLISLVLLIGVPVLFCTIYDVFPTFSQFMGASGGLLAIFIPMGIANVMVYVPLLGTGTYLALITGNLINLKIPAAVNANQIADTNPGSEEADVIATLAIGISSMLTIVVIAIGVLLLVPLEPILTLPTVKLATKYILPALFGSMLAGMIFPTGKVRVEKQWTAGILPFCLVLVYSYLKGGLGTLQGAALLLMLPVTIFSAKVLYKKGIIKYNK